MIIKFFFQNGLRSERANRRQSLKRRVQMREYGTARCNEIRGDYEWKYGRKTYRARVRFRKRAY